jgi:hypothetical protein
LVRISQFWLSGPLVWSHRVFLNVHTRVEKRRASEKKRGLTRNYGFRNAICSRMALPRTPFFDFSDRISAQPAVYSIKHSCATGQGTGPQGDGSRVESVLAVRLLGYAFWFGPPWSGSLGTWSGSVLEYVRQVETLTDRAAAERWLLENLGRFPYTTSLIPCGHEHRTCPDGLLLLSVSL